MTTTIALRHRCRNAGHCGQKLSEPVDSPRKAFCCRGCYEQFFRKRCVVCERAKPNVNARICGRRPCKAELRKWPDLYVFRAKDRQSPTTCKADARSAHSTGVKTRSVTRRAPLNLLGGYQFPNPVKVGPDLVRHVVDIEARLEPDHLPVLRADAVPSIVPDDLWVIPAFLERAHGLR